MDKKLRVGVVGLGIGRAHIGGFQKHPKAEVVAIADIDEQRLKRAGDEFSIPGRYTDYRKMLKSERLDIVSVATPNVFHKPITIAALEAGCHVLCEKPMAMNATEARAMAAAAKKARRRLMINFSYRFNEQAWIMKKQVQSGILGDIYFGRTVWHRRRGMPGFGGWFGQKKMSGGGPLIDLGVHRLDLALWLMDYPKPSVIIGSTYDHIARPIAKKEGKKFDVEDLACGMIKFKKGATLIVEASWAANIKEAEQMSTRLLGTKGGLLHFNLNAGYDFDMELYIEQNGSQFNIALDKKMSVKDKPASAMAHLADCIIANKPHIATAEEGIIVMEILDAIYRSAESGKPVNVK